MFVKKFGQFSYINHFKLFFKVNLPFFTSLSVSSGPVSSARAPSIAHKRNKCPLCTKTRHNETCLIQGPSKRSFRDKALLYEGHGGGGIASRS